ncbi:FecCD family ABC transporter permease [Streptomyces mayteni]
MTTTTRRSVPTGFAPSGFVPAGHLRCRLPGNRSLLVHRHSAVTVAVAAALALLVAAFTVLTGAYEITPGGVVSTFFGGGSDTDRFIVLDQRLPRAVAALLVGVALGGCGAVFQSVARNPLGSPDIVGFTTGAASGGLVMILVVGSAGSQSILVGTVAGGALAAVTVVLFTLRRGLGGDRLVLSGIAVGAMLAALNDYLISRAPIEAAETAKAWQYGSLNAIGWRPVVPLALALALAVPVTLALARSLRALELGDDAAAGIGLGVTATRVTALAVGVFLAGAAIATAGPIGFLALAAPQLAGRLSRAPGIALGPSMAVGALLLTVADLLAQRLLSPFQIPVGLLTAAVGGAYLVWLLTRAPRRAGANGAR